MSKKSRLQRTRKEIIHSIKTQQQVDVFPAREFEMVMGSLWSRTAYRLTKIVSFSPDERAFTLMLPNLTVD